MAKVRHGVAGEPIGHSLSPVLTALVHSHISRTEGVDIPGLKGVVVIPTDGVENALAWGYAGSLPSPPDWELVGSPLGKFRANTLLERAVTASMEHVDADPRLPNAPLPELNFKTPLPGNEEVWLSLTAPLKHQLSAAAVQCVDNAMQIRSVNALRWDGRSWWAASTDGPGMMLVAEAFGHHSTGVLGIVGGGGTARSVAASWCENGGKIRQLGGNRLLEEDGPWVLCDDEPAFVIDFDNGKGDIIVTYEPMEGDFDSRIKHLASVADGRWLLCAQHLHSWASIWAPKYTDYLPSLSLLMTRLVAVEVHLE
jgi:hypothetical protein|tara:strand:- start:215 stop:1147 length:933 start_codon:yes stop_codon:yes gene_type:complete